MPNPATSNTQEQEQQMQNQLPQDQFLDFHSYLICTVINCGELDFNDFKEDFLVYDEFYRDGERINQSVIFHLKNHTKFDEVIKKYLKYDFLKLFTATNKKLLQIYQVTPTGVMTFDPIEDWEIIKHYIIELDKRSELPFKDYTKEELMTEIQYSYYKPIDLNDREKFEPFLNSQREL
jgi:hypothetical protein